MITEVFEPGKTFRATSSYTDEGKLNTWRCRQAASKVNEHHDIRLMSRHGKGCLT